MKNKFIKTLFLSTLMISVIGCKDKQNKYVAPPPPKVSVMTPVVKNITDYAVYPGYTQSTEVVQLKARVSGFLQEVKFIPSQKVKKGDLLFVIEKTQYLAAVEKAKANIDKCKANLALAEATLKRKSSAFADQAISELDLLDAQANVAMAKAEIIQANALLIDAELNLSYTEVRSPINGIIDRNLIDVGNLVGPNENSLLATVINNTPIYVNFSIGEDDLLKFIEHQKRSPKVELEIGLGNEGDFPYKGKFDFMDNRINNETGTIALRGKVDNEDSYLLSGLYTRVRFAVKKIDNAIMIPDYAIMRNQRGNIVMVVDDKNVARAKVVELGVKEKGLIQITSGLAANEKVIVSGLLKARPNSQVDPEMVK